SALDSATLRRDFRPSITKYELESGSLVELLPGFFAGITVSDDPRVRLGALARWAPPGSAISGLAACALQGLVDEFPAVITLLLPPGARRAVPPWVRVARPRTMPATLPGTPVRALGPHPVCLTEKEVSVVIAWT